MKSLFAAALLGVLLACGGTEAPPPTPTEATLTVDPTALELTSLSEPVQVTADPHGLEGPVLWSLAGPGTLSPPSGATTTYAPPEEVDAPVTAILTATLGTQHVDIPIHLSLSRFFVNPVSGADDQVGSQAHPFKTVSRGMKAASSGMAVVLQDGVYPWSDEDPALPLPVGVTLRGETPDGAVLDGSTPPVHGLTLSGDATVSFLHFKGFTGSALSATTGSLFSQHLIVESGAGVQLGGDVKATLEDFDFTLSGASRGLWIHGSAQVAASDGVVRSGKVNFAPVWIHQKGTLTAKDVDIDSVDLGLQLADQAAAVFNGGRFTRSVAGGSQPLVLVGAEAQLSLDAATVSDDFTPTLDSYGQLTLTWTQVSSGGTALVVEGGELSASDTRFTVQSDPGTAVSLAAGTTSVLDRVHVVSNVGGIRAGGTLNLIDSAITAYGYGLTVRANTTVTGSTVEGQSVGLYSTGTLTLRNSTVRSNGVYGHALLLTGAADLGTVADPGGNTFQATQTLLWHLDPELATPADPLEVWAVGNLWKANVQGADGTGHYPSRTDITGVVTGENVTLVKGEDAVHL
jgi:hypothetical protein